MQHVQFCEGTTVVDLSSSVEAAGSILGMKLGQHYIPLCVFMCLRAIPSMEQVVLLQEALL
jgi:hypothetical protein